MRVGGSIRTRRVKPFTARPTFSSSRVTANEVTCSAISASAGSRWRMRICPTWRSPGIPKTAASCVGVMSIAYGSASGANLSQAFATWPSTCR